MALRKLGLGDIILLDNAPKPGQNHEQKGKRPWLVLSATKLNETSPFVIAAPFTSTLSNYPLSIDWRAEVNAADSQTTGMLLLEQLTCLDVQQRSYRLLEHIAPDKLPPTLQMKEKALLGIQ